MIMHASDGCAAVSGADSGACRPRRCRGLQELAEWNPAKRKLTPISGGATFSLRDISRSLDGIKNTPVMVPTQRAFEAGLSAICRGDDDALDALVTIAATEREVRTSAAAWPPQARLPLCGGGGSVMIYKWSCCSALALHPPAVQG